MYTTFRTASSFGYKSTSQYISDHVLSIKHQVAGIKLLLIAKFDKTLVLFSGREITGTLLENDIIRFLYKIIQIELKK